jgi:hypothetical protein
MGCIKRTLVVAPIAAALLATPAQAGKIIVVDGDHAVRKNDPAVPSRADISLAEPSPGAAAGGVRGRVLASGRLSPARARAAGSASARRAVARAIGRARGVSAADKRRWERSYALSLRTLSRLSGARAAQLRYVISSVERLALRGSLTPSRMPVAFLQVDRNRQYWPKLPFPGARDQVSFRGSQLVFEYFPGEGLQVHPLNTFKRANALHGFCERGEPTCDRAALRSLLDEMTGLAARRSPRFIAWEYMFDFGGGSPPWMSGMAQATGIQAYGRAAQLLGEPSYLKTARAALGAFETPPPVGVRTTGPRGGVAYLQYSFAPRLYIFNAFLQTLIGLYDFSKLAPDNRAGALFREAEPEARAEVPFSDVGDWSRYSYAGAESTAEYHELLRELLQSMCTRRLGDIYCDYAKRYRGYQVDPPELRFVGPQTASEDVTTSIRFTVSKLSAVEVKVYKGNSLAFQRLGTFRRGGGSFAWRPSSPGLYTVGLAAKELRTGFGKRDRVTGEIEVQAH